VLLGVLVQETYGYYELPYCKPAHGIETHKRSAGIGEILEGHALVNSGLKLHFASKFRLEMRIFVSDGAKTILHSKY
jgi:hypothetical protein